jgi:glutamate synthase (NADPH/NADH) small chain
MNIMQVFLGIGLGGVNALGAETDSDDISVNAVDFIAELRQAQDFANGRGRAPCHGDWRRYDGH